MREIKFRAKDMLERNWYVGSYMFTNDNTNNPFRSGPFKESHRIIFYSSCDWNMGGWNDVEIDPFTLGQYTGLKDKNGKEIYEGDIIRSFDSSGDIILHYIVWKEEEEARFMAFYKGKTFRSECFLNQSWIDEFEKEVVGNIYDNNLQEWHIE